jgi:hypothetical protein
MEENKEEKKEYNKTPDPNSRPIKYLKARIEGKNKNEAQKEAGFADTKHPTRIENTKTYKAGLEKYLLDEGKVAKEHNKNIIQDNDKGAKNTAIKMWYQLNSKFPKESGDLDTGDLKIIVKKGD